MRGAPRIVAAAAARRSPLLKTGGLLQAAVIKAWETEKKDVQIYELDVDIGGVSPPIIVHTRTLHRDPRRRRGGGERRESWAPGRAHC